jgi:hypothetical protein
MYTFPPALNSGFQYAAVNGPGTFKARLPSLSLDTARQPWINIMLPEREKKIPIKYYGDARMNLKRAEEGGRG